MQRSLLVFSLYAWQDFRRWCLAGELNLVYGSFDLILKSRNDLFTIAQFSEKLTCDNQLQDGIRSAIAAAAEQLPKSQLKLQELNTSLNRLNLLQWLRVIIIEIGFPIALGGFAFWKVSAALIPFLSAAVK